jgi:hypothetical protein
MTVKDRLTNFEEIWKPVSDTVDAAADVLKPGLEAYRKEIMMISTQ